jgi:hypothetical protein
MRLGNRPFSSAEKDSTEARRSLGLADAWTGALHIVLYTSFLERLATLLARVSNKSQENDETIIGIFCT